MPLGQIFFPSTFCDPPTPVPNAFGLYQTCLNKAVLTIFFFQNRFFGPLFTLYVMFKWVDWVVDNENDESMFVELQICNDVQS